MQSYLIDTHTHLDSKEFDPDREECLVRARDAGVWQIVDIGATDGFEGARRAQSLSESYTQIFHSIGIHPHDADRPLDIVRLKGMLSHPKAVAVGETGLDFFRDWSPKEKQYEWFRAQVSLALEVQKPIIIHCRDASSECLAVLQEMEAHLVGGVFHCYPESAEFARKLQEMNFRVSFPGPVTFPKSQALRETVKEIPLEQMMVETDAPYMAPVPHRGKRCESAFVRDTASVIAEVKEISLEELAASTTVTAQKLFGLPPVESIKDVYQKTAGAQ